MSEQTAFPVLTALIMDYFYDVDEVFVDPPYVFLLKHKNGRAIRFWVPETLDGDVELDGNDLVLRAVPPNATIP